MAGRCASLTIGQRLGVIAMLTMAAPGVSREGQFGLADRQMVVDGRLDEPAWQAANPVTQFFEVYPANLGVPTVRTDARFLYDEHYIYVGIRAYDPRPTAIRSAPVRRDQVLTDQDYVEVLVDPTNGGHSAFLFRTNPKGVATDGQFNEETQLRDYTPDFNFDVSATVDDQGWTAEFRIPLSTFRYKGGDKQAWTLMILRNLPREKTLTLASGPIARKANCTLCFAPKVGGLSLPAERDPIAITPYVAFSHNEARNDGVTTNSNVGHAGFDLKWQPKSDTVVDLTVAPDFSQIEADDLQLTANTRFALLVTEKRPFFLEGADLLSTATVGVNAIYTRAFTAPDAGARVTRRGDDYEYAAMILRDTGGGTVVEPGPIVSQLVAQDFASTAFVGRLKLHEGAVTWGTLATARLNDDGSKNLVYGADASWAPTSTDRIFVQALGSQTRNPDRPDLLASWTGQRLDGAAGALTWTHSSSTWYSDVYVQSESRGFRAWDGYVPQVGVSYVTADAGMNFYPRHSFLVRVTPAVAAYYIRQIGGGELGKYAAPGLVLEAPGNSTFSAYWYPRFEDITLAGLRTHEVLSLTLKSAPASWLPEMTVTALVGEGLDATTGEIGNGLTVQATVPIRLFNRLEFRPTLAYQSLDSRRTGIAQKRLFTEIDTQADTLWYFSNRCYLEALYQRSQFTGAPQIDPISLETRSTGTLSSLLLSYQTNWQTRYYVGVRHGTTLLEGVAPTRGNQTEVFAKLTYALSR